AEVHLRFWAGGPESTDGDRAPHRRLARSVPHRVPTPPIPVLRDSRRPPPAPFPHCLLRPALRAREPARRRVPPRADRELLAWAQQRRRATEWLAPRISSAGVAHGHVCIRGPRHTSCIVSA